MDRDRPDEPHAWEGVVGDALVFDWDTLAEVGMLRLVFDSNLNNDKRMPCSYPQKGDRCLVPRSLVRRFKVEVRDADGHWRTAHAEDNNYQRLARIPLLTRATAVRFTPEATWGADTVRVFALEPLSVYSDKLPRPEPGKPWSRVVAEVDPADLAPPEHGLDEAPKRAAHSA